MPIKTIPQIQIKPQNSLEEKILSCDLIKKGLSFGEIRKNHPEGSIQNHIALILDYIDKGNFGEYRNDLRVLTLIHDTFKYLQFEGGTNHSFYASIFYQKLVPSYKRISDILLHHDTAFGLFKREKNEGIFSKIGFKLIYGTLDLDLLIRFNYCDNCLREKDTTIWFENKLEQLKLKNRPKNKIYESLNN